MRSIDQLSMTLADTVSYTTSKVGLVLADQKQGTCWSFSKHVMVTNAHVVSDSLSDECKVRVNGKLIHGSIVGFDERTDIAVIRTKEALAPLELKLDARVGEICLAVGNPFGNVNSVSMGVVSGLHRSIESGKSVLEDLVQTDAAINDGISGGPLVAVDGRVIGMCTLSRSQAEAIHFAVSSQTIRFVVPILLKRRKVVYGKIGALLAEEVALDGAIGVRVVRPLGTESALRVRDLIVGIEDMVIDRRIDVLLAMATFSSQRSFSVSVRRDGLVRNLKVVNRRD
jgi:S1-C subfamily serine protease